MSVPNDTPHIRPRRLRRHPAMRTMLKRTRLTPADFIAPVFVCEGENVQREVPSMPGVYQLSVDKAIDFLKRVHDTGVCSYLVFGIIAGEQKDHVGTPAVDHNNVVCRMLETTREQLPTMLAITDLCMCEYTDHGHCGPITTAPCNDHTVDNDRTLPLLSQQAVNHAKAGADVVAPSGMMDGMVAAIRSGLDAAGFTDTAILSYAVKYASGFYGPFRDAAESAPTFGDRRTYQMDPARDADEAIRETLLDIEQGADMTMVKPAGAYLDIIAAVRQQSDIPLAAYQVSGEYSMLTSAIAKGWLDQRVIAESLLAIKRAGADLIISYFADRLGELGIR